MPSGEKWRMVMSLDLQVDVMWWLEGEPAACAAMVGVKHATSVKSGFVVGGAICACARHESLAVGDVAKLPEHEDGLV